MVSVEHEKPHLPSREKRIARLDLARRFLDEQIMPRVADKEDNFYWEDIMPMYIEFKKNNPGLGDDFDIAHTWGVAWTRELAVNHVLKNNPEELPENAETILIASYFLGEAVFDTSPGSANNRI